MAYKAVRVPTKDFKKITFREEIIEKIIPGIQKVARAVSATLGPNGKNSIIKLNIGHRYTKDGVTVARNISFEDRYENTGAELVREVAEKTCKEVGDGTTQSIILVNSLINNGLDEIKNGKRVDELAREIKADTDLVIGELQKESIDIKNKQQIIDVASISANDRELGNLIGGVYHKIGKEGVIITEESGTLETYVEEVDGIRLDKGIISPYFITNQERLKSELDDVYIFISDLEIASFAPFVELLKRMRADNNNNPISILVIADKITGEAASGFMLNHVRGHIRCACIETPDNKIIKNELLEDLAVMTGGKFISRDLQEKIADLDIESLGRANKVISGKDNTTIVGPKGVKKNIKNRINLLKEEFEKTKNKHLEFRISGLRNKISILRVGGSTQSEIEEKKYRIEDAVESTKVAMKGGIIIGGEISLLNASQKLNDGVVKRACTAPFKKLLENIDRNYKDIIDKVGGKIGFNASTEKIENFFKAGIIDPVLVPITSLRNAASVAVNILKTDNVVFNYKDLDEPTDSPLTLNATD